MHVFFRIFHFPVFIMAEERRRLIRQGPLMDVNTSTYDLLKQVNATHNCKHNYQEAYLCYEWGREHFLSGTFDRNIQAARRLAHYESIAIDFHTFTTDRKVIRMFTGHSFGVFQDVCANQDVMEYLRAVKPGYFNCAYTDPRCPITEKMFLVIAMNYMDNGNTYKMAKIAFRIPNISYCVKEGINALKLLNNIQLPTTEEAWVTSALGFEQKHGLPNVVMLLDVTPIYGMSKNPDHLCPETKRHCLKLATVIDSSGKYLAYKIFDGRITEPEYLQSWDFYHRLKATEAAIGFPGATAGLWDARPFDMLPGKLQLQRFSAIHVPGGRLPADVNL